MNKGYTELVFILDKSGSMSGLESDTIGGFNAMLAKQRALDTPCRITTVLFDNHYKTLHDRIDLCAVLSLTKNDYCVGGNTALYDAIGLTIDKIVLTQKMTAPAYRAEKVLFIIITDGHENASHFFTQAKIKAKIEYEKAHYGWEFIFLGANIDAVAAADAVGIHADRAANYIADELGTQLNFKAMSETVAAFRTNGTIPTAPLDAIRLDMESRSRHL